MYASAALDLSENTETTKLITFLLQAISNTNTHTCFVQSINRRLDASTLSLFFIHMSHQTLHKERRKQSAISVSSYICIIFVNMSVCKRMCVVMHVGRHSSKSF